MSRTAKKDSIERRRAEVSALLDGSYSQRDIAQALKISTSTVSKDIKELRKLWRNEQLENVEDIMVADLHRISSMVSALWAEAMTGRVDAIDRVAKLIELRARILGYNDFVVRDPGKEPSSQHVGRVKITEVVVELPPFSDDPNVVIDGSISDKSE